MANEIRDAWRAAWRKYVTDGVPSSGENEPDKEQILPIGDMLQQQIDDVRSQASTGTQWAQNPVDLATTGNIALMGEQTIDGVLTSGSDVLVKDQATGSQNGIYQTGPGAWVRRSDADTSDEILSLAVFVRGGTINGGKQFVCGAKAPITIGTTALPFREISDQSALNANLAGKADQAEVDEISERVDHRLAWALVGASKIGRKIAAWAAGSVAFLTLDDSGRLGFIRDNERNVSNAVGGYQYALVASGRIVWGVLGDGLFFIPSAKLLSEFAKRLHLTPEGVTGAGNAPVWGVERLGASLLRFQGEVAGAVRGYMQRTGDTGFVSEAGPVIDLILTSGQSTDAGFVSTGEKIATTAKYPGHAMMFNSGIRGPFNNTVLTDTSFASLVPAEEIVVSNNGETGGVAMLRLLTERRRTAKVTDNAAIYRCHGVNGYRLDQLDKANNTGPYRNSVLAAKSAKRLADDYGREVICRAVYWSQGHADQADYSSAYDAALAQLAADYDADIRAATGQSETVLFVMDPPPTSSLGTEYQATLAQYRLQRDNPLFRISVPGYIVRVGDGIHYLAQYYGLRGEYRAKVQWALEQGLDWTPLRPVPISPISRIGSTLTLTLEGGVGNIVVDTDKCPAQPNYGFVYQDDSSSASIGSVTVNSAERTITIELTAEPTGANRKLYYAWKHNGDDDLSRPGAMGNIFDSDQTPSLMGIAEFPTLQNPLITFEETVP